MTINAYTQFSNLIKGEGKAVITIATIDPVAETSTGTTSDGTSVNLIGFSVAVGKNAYVVGYEIVGLAPDVTIVTLEV